MTDGYETAYQDELKRFQKPLDMLSSHMMSPEQLPPPSTLGDVVRIIRAERNLDDVAPAIIAFRAMSGDKNIKMFDFKAVNAWCASHEPQCK